MAYGIKFLLLALPAALFAQGPQFEVASLKPMAPVSPGAGRGGEAACSFKVDPARVEICDSLAGLIASAYGVPVARVVGPDWMRPRSGQRFRVEAKLPAGASPAQIPEMLQTLLTERFKLAVHRGTREDLVTALVVAKSGLKLQEAEPPAESTPPTDSTIRHYGGLATYSWNAASPDGKDIVLMLSNPRIGTVRAIETADHGFRWEAPSTTLAGLADIIDMGFVPPLVDQTGLSGRYKVTLEVSLQEAFEMTVRTRGETQEILQRAFSGPLLKLGLQMGSRKATVETLVVDHAEQSPSGN